LRTPGKPDDTISSTYRARTTSVSPTIWAPPASNAARLAVQEASGRRAVVGGTADAIPGLGVALPLVDQQLSGERRDDRRVGPHLLEIQLVVQLQDGGCPTSSRLVLIRARSPPRVDGMPTLVHEFDWPDRLVVGTVGRPGERTFYLQARAGTRTASVALEKQQSVVLAETIDQLLDELRSQNDGLTIPADAPVELVDTDPLDQPVEEDFRTGAIRLGWDPRTSQVLIEAFPVGEDPSDPDEGEPSEMLRVRIPVGTARAFVQRTRAVVEAGRPTCPLCGEPIDGEGHECAPTDEA
jgi:uncharacterized repeat protein (TIGR03847 family)